MRIIRTKLTQHVYSEKIILSHLKVNTVKVTVLEQIQLESLAIFQQECVSHFPMLTLFQTTLFVHMLPSALWYEIYPVYFEQYCWLFQCLAKVEKTA